MFSFLWLEDAEAFVCLAIAAIATAGRLAAAAIQAPPIKILRLDMATPVRFILSLPSCNLPTKKGVAFLPGGVVETSVGKLNGVPRR
jgi:hypothetical protein